MSMMKTGYVKAAQRAVASATLLPSPEKAAAERTVQYQVDDLQRVVKMVRTPEGLIAMAVILWDEMMDHLRKGNGEAAFIALKLRERLIEPGGKRYVDGPSGFCAVE